MIALIDADSIVYIIAWNYREYGNSDTVAEVEASCDQYLKDILTITGADKYLGVFSPPSDATFRYRAYKYAEYKGNRPAKPEFITRWEKIIKDHYVTKHGFFTDPELEADDVVAGVADLWQVWPQISDPDPQGLGYKVPHVICSPDKDLNQVPGWHYDYRAKVKEGEAPPSRYWIKHEESFWTFWTQMLTGDSDDNVAGVPGLGPVKVKKILDELRNDGNTIHVRNTVQEQYRKYFGSHYGPLVFAETEIALRLMTRSHPMYDRFQHILQTYATNHTRELVKPSGFFDLTS